jgi:hypothetical protein
MKENIPVYSPLIFKVAPDNQKTVKYFGKVIIHQPRFEFLHATNLRAAQ